MSCDLSHALAARQVETSHWSGALLQCMRRTMSESEIFRTSLIRLRAERGLSAAELSRRAGLNVRAVTDIEERRSQSPKLATVFALARALDVAPGEMIGLGAQARIKDELAEFLSRYDEEDQARLLAALHAIAPEPSE